MRATNFFGTLHLLLLFFSAFRPVTPTGGKIGSSATVIVMASEGP